MHLKKKKGKRKKTFKEFRIYAIYLMRISYHPRLTIFFFVKRISHNVIWTMDINAYLQFIKNKRN